MMAQLRIDFQERRKVETVAGVRVQPMGNGIECQDRSWLSTKQRGLRLFGQPPRSHKWCLEHF